MSAEIYLLRHGETLWNVEGRFQGRLDSPLTARGVQQAERCGRKLAATLGQVDAVVASPLGRVRQTPRSSGRSAAIPRFAGTAGWRRSRSADGTG